MMNNKKITGDSGINEPVRVLHLLNKLTFGGTEKVILNLFNRSSHNVQHFICSLTDYDEAFVEKISSGREKIVCLGKGDGIDLSMALKIASFCNDNAIDIIHSLGWGTYVEGFLASFLMKKKRCFLHSFRGKTAEDTIYIPRRRIWAQHFFSYFCSAIVTPSMASRKDYSGMVHINPNRINVIYNGVDTHQFSKMASDRVRAFKKEFHIRDGEIVIGTVGRFDPVKNIGGLVAAFINLPGPLRNGSRLLLVGDGPEAARIKRFSEQQGVAERIIFVGMRSDVADLLNIMDVYVQPSHFEGVPNAVLEAMGCALPVVATDVGGVAEVVENGITGVLVPPDSSDALTSAIRNLVCRPEKMTRLGRAGYHRVCNRFSIEKMVSDYEQLFRRLTRRQAGNAPHV